MITAVHKRYNYEVFKTVDKELASYMIKILDSKNIDYKCVGKPHIWRFKVCKQLISNKEYNSITAKYIIAKHEGVPDTLNLVN